MGEKPKVLAWAGSTRQESFNKKLVRIAARAAEQAGAEVTLVDLADFRMPLFDQDLEAAQGPPENATKLKRLMVEREGFLISAPEYNSSVTGVLKNAIDWVSRPVAGEPNLVAFQGKTAAIMSASPGALGGLRGLVHLRAILGNIGVLILPGQVGVAKAHEAFDGEGRLKDPNQQSSIERLGAELAAILKKLRS
jgi:chromate reductase, NAD(P)H dehydrogenase (quinone)